MPQLLPGFRLGHTTDTKGWTGCTVLLCPPGTTASAEVRGSSPGSRELALLAPEKSMQEVHALLLTGGSAYGLAAADGVMRWLEVHDRGYQTPWGIVPIVPAAVVFDLNVGSRSTRPTADAGYRACDEATTDAGGQGNVGAGTGATVGKWNGTEFWMKGGFGVVSATAGSLEGFAMAVVNAVGDVLDDQGRIIAGARDDRGGFAGAAQRVRILSRAARLERSNTTLVAAALNGAFTKLELFRIAQRMHDGMARAIVPAHTSYDGDVAFALANGTERYDLDLAAEFAAHLTSEAIRSAVRHAHSIPGVPGLAG